MNQNCRTAVAIAVYSMALACGAQGQQPSKPLVEMSLEELSDLRVTSVSRRPEPWTDAPASIYVITGEEIRRSGASTLAEALRLAPNLLVARYDAGQYAISARGFNSNIANKLLVMVDGRTIYSPLFSGVFWDLQDVMLRDVERIEVISGPGGSQWGTNAVNGVINVISRAAGETQGPVARVGAGERESVAAFRYGGALQDDTSYRVYAKAWRGHDLISGGGIGAAPGHDRAQAGFRTDWRAGRNAMMVEGGAVTGASDNRRLPAAQGVDVNGGHLLGRWMRALEAGAELQVQAYFDRTEHDDRLLLDEKSDLFDFEVRHAFPMGRHRMQWGGGYRHARDETAPGLLFAFTPATRTLDWTNLFAEGYLQVRDDLQVTLGARLEENSYTGWEWLPNARVAWKPISQHLLWAALSRAVRAPSRLDREVATPPRPPFIVIPGATFESETANVAEVGWRGQLARTLTVSGTLYVQEYDHLRSAELTNGGFPVVPGNSLEGSVSGLEAWAYWQASPSWRLSAGFTTLESRLRRQTGSTDPVGPGNLGNHPSDQLMLRSSSNIGERQELDVMVRRVGSMAPNRPNTVAVAAYTALDLRYAFKFRPHTQLALVIRNALDPVHREWGDVTTGSEIRRSAMVMLEWNP